jgi:hypothetical protein
MARAAKSPKNENSIKKQVATESEITSSPEFQSNTATFDVEAEIRRRAYELYERRGCTPGHESEDWLIAEREISGRHQQQRA